MDVVKRCSTGKKKYIDAGHAAAYVRPGEFRGLYRCQICGYFHLTKRRQKP